METEPLAGGGGTTSDGQKGRGRRKGHDATKEELVKRALEMRHIDGAEPEKSTPFKTRELAAACGQSDSGKLLVSESTARRRIREIFGSNERYKDAVRKNAVLFHLKGLGEATRSVGSVDSAKLAEMVADDGTLKKRQQRGRNDD